MSLLLRRAGAALLGLAALAIACSTPSSEIDGSDLRGVFDSRPSPSAAASSASAARSARPSPSAAASALPSVLEPVVVPLRRAAPAGPCIVARGEAAPPPKRFLGRPACRGATVLEWQDADGAPRYGCVYAPDDAVSRAPLPLVVFFHAEGSRPSAVGEKTKLRRRIAKFELGEGGRHQGFVVLAPQARRSEGFDLEYTAPDNPDVATTDHYVDDLAAQGLADPERIYALGDARGGAMAMLYATLRPDRVAAVAAFAAEASAFGWSCAGIEPPALLLYRACDSVLPCDAVEQWLERRRRRGALTRGLRLGPSKSEEPYCTPRTQCGKNQGTANHQRWPDLREPDILEFFSRYSLETSTKR